MNATAIFSVFSVFIAAPLIVFGFILFMRKSKNRLEEMKLKRDILQLEMAKEQLHLETMREENRKYDRIIGSRIEEEAR
jgi:hypothetical protein